MDPMPPPQPIAALHLTDGAARSLGRLLRSRDPAVRAWAAAVIRRWLVSGRVTTASAGLPLRGIQRPLGQPLPQT